MVSEFRVFKRRWRRSSLSLGLPPLEPDYICLGSKVNQSNNAWVEEGLGTRQKKQQQQQQQKMKKNLWKSCFPVFCTLCDPFLHAVSFSHVLHFDVHIELKLKSSFCMVIMLDHPIGNPYIHSTTALCDNSLIYVLLATCNNQMCGSATRYKV